MILSRRSQIYSTIPSQLGQLTSLTYLHLSDTELSGSLPSEIASMSILRHFEASNTNLGGTIPEEWYHGLLKMNSLLIAGNRFSGTISKSIRLWQELGTLDISNNNFTGTLPDVFGGIAQLLFVRLNGNDFSAGTAVPESLCNHALSENSYHASWELVADCAVPNATIIGLECPPGCCTACCTPGEDVCRSN